MKVSRFSHSSNALLTLHSSGAKTLKIHVQRADGLSCCKQKERGQKRTKGREKKRESLTITEPLNKYNQTQAQTMMDNYPLKLRMK